MTFVYDPNDPNGQGMFSKPGRITSAKYIVLQRQAEILNDQRKYVRTSSLPELLLNPDPKDNALKQIQDEAENKIKQSPVVQKKNHISPFSKQLSREGAQKSKEGKHSAPPAAFYNPKYSFVEKKTTVLFNYGKEKARPTSSTRSRIKIDEEEMAKPVPDKLKKKIVGAATFKQQISREYYFRPDNNPHEDRFNYLDFPNSFSKAKKVPSVSIGKTTGRDSRSSIRERGVPDYDPNYEFVKKQLGSSGPSFEKRSSRKSLANISCCTNDSFFNVNQSITLKYPRQKETDFIRELPREWDPQNPLPSFMQKGNNSRLSVGSLNQKALEINNFSDAKFQATHSSFSLPPSRVETKKNSWKI